MTTRRPTTRDFADFLRHSNQFENLQYFEKTLTEEERDAMSASYFSNCELDWNQLEEKVNNALAAKSLTDSFYTKRQLVFSSEAISNPALNIFDKRSSLAFKWNELGLESLIRGECAVCILAGGQATRLNQGSTTPKGCFVIPYLPSQKSLFQILVEKVQKAEIMAFEHHQRCPGKIISYPRIPVLILTSEENNEETKNFFRKHELFGLQECQLFFLTQPMLPVFRFESMKSLHPLSFIFKSQTEVAFAPSGNGAFYSALAVSGLSKHLRDIGVRYIQICPVDNPLVNIADTAFLGLCIQEKIDVGCKGFSVPIEDFNKNAGVFCADFASSTSKVNWSILEYSELDENLLARHGKRERHDGYVIANMAVHCLSLSFCDQVWNSQNKLSRQAYSESTSMYHIAKKNIPTCQLKEGVVEGIKLESFIFDEFHQAEKLGILIVDKASEFSPIKRADSPLSDIKDFGKVPEGTPLAARLAILRNDLRQLPFGSLRDMNKLSIDMDALSFEIDPMVPILLPTEMLRLGLTKHDSETQEEIPKK
ncbi:UDP-N-acetylglucosamine pyrophosphorylase [Perkinsela sp. CCAP 1560/4]|nr:UDP-N-acetylglucosamine pyrophosphorylase [Perkinsela sp. CCAP 1560/4]|eukprot:KNH07769.1 UDP-N-acetylglucosamine pyrophosphorylase [Perkinsela sp. CCAP 1560/4]